MGKKPRLKPPSTRAKLIFPQVSDISRPVAFGYQ